jgi:TolA-binding protein
MRLNFPSALLIREFKAFLATSFLAIFFLASCQGEAIKKEIDRAEAFRNNGKYLKAIEAYQKVIDSSPESSIATQSLYEIGNIYYLCLNDYPRALRFFSQLIYSYPESRWAVFSQKNIADIYLFKIGDFEWAISEYDELIKVENLGTIRRDEIVYNIARCYFDLNNFEQSRIEYRSLLERFPNTSFAVEAYFRIATTLYLQGEHEEAIKAYEEVVKRFPKEKRSAEARFEIASLLEEMGELEKALDIYRKLLRSYHNEEMVRARIDQVKERLEAKER